jgi:hypothetical protein
MTTWSWKTGPKGPKDEIWLTVITSLAGLFPRDFEVDLIPAEGSRVRTVITFSADKKWQAAQLCMALLDQSYEPIEASKTREEYRVSFLWPASMDCPYVTSEA